MAYRVRRRTTRERVPGRPDEARRRQWTESAVRLAGWFVFADDEELRSEWIAAWTRFWASDGLTPAGGRAITAAVELFPSRTLQWTVAELAARLMPDGGRAFAVRRTAAVLDGGSVR